MIPIVITTKVLSVIDERAKECGYFKAVQEMLNLPSVKYEVVKEFAIRRIQSEPASFFDSSLTARSWLKGFEDALSLICMDIKFSFEIDRYIRSGPSIPSADPEA